MNCPNCQNHCIDSDSFCIKCGFDLLKYKAESADNGEKICPDCSAKCKADDPSCLSCGYPFGQLKKPIPPPVKPTVIPVRTDLKPIVDKLPIHNSSGTTSTSSDSNRPLIISLVAVIAIVIVFILVFRHYNGPKGDDSIGSYKENTPERENEVFVYTVKFIECDCSPRFHTYTFQTENGDNIDVDVEEFKRNISFFCDLSFNSNSMINPYKNSKFKLTYNKAIDKPDKKLIDIELVDEIHKSYKFKSGLGGKYQLKIDNLDVNLIYSYLDNNEMEAIKVDFKANKSIQKSEYCEYLYFISNSKDLIEDSNSEVVLGEYNPETDSYDLYYLEK